ncbi:hypothetical protein, partial [Oerskovia rustica]
PTDPTDTTDPTDQGDPTDATDTTDPTDQGDQGDQADQADPSSVAEPAAALLLTTHTVPAQEALVASKSAATTTRTVTPVKVNHATVSSALAHTGAEVGAYALGAALLLGVGGVITVLARRTRRSER